MSQKPISIAAVIAVHNRLDYTRRCLRCLAQATDEASLQIIVIDDGSNDDTAEWIEANCPEIILLHGDGQLWFGGATDWGIRHAIETLDCDYIFTVNNDTFMQEGSLDAMLKVADSHTVVTTNLWAEDLDRLGTAGFIFQGARGMKSVTQFPEKLDAAREAGDEFLQVDGVATTATLFPVALLKNVKAVNLKRNPHNRYDALLSAHLHRAGARFLVSLKPLALHIYGDAARYRSCKELSFKEFWRSRLTDPVNVCYVPGRFELAYKAAPNHFVALVGMLRCLIFFIAQMCTVAVFSVARCLRRK